MRAVLLPEMDEGGQQFCIIANVGIDEDGVEVEEGDYTIYAIARKEQLEEKQARLSSRSRNGAAKSWMQSIYECCTGIRVHRTSTRHRTCPRIGGCDVNMVDSKVKKERIVGLQGDEALTSI